MERIEIVENGLFLVFEIADDKCFKFLHFGKKPFNEKDIIARSTSYGFRFVEINLAGYDRPYERHGNKYIVTAPGWHMRYESMEDGRNQNGRIVMFVLRDEITDVIVKSYMQFYDGLSIIRFWNIVENTGSQTQVLDYISSFNYEGIDKEGSLPADKKLQIRIPHNGWQKEVNWKTYDLCDFGMERIQPACDQRSSNLLTVSNTGNWSAKEHLPMGYLENTQTHTGMLWQIENNGSWHWEIGDQNGHLYLAQPPLYKVYKTTKGKEISKYAYSDEELEKVKKEIGKGALIQRYKGLGEMNPDQLWDTTLNPETRTLFQVTIEDAAKAEKMVSLLMGDVVEPRKNYMYKYAEF